MAETHIVINKTNNHKNHDDEFLLSPSSSSGSAFDPELQRPGGARSSSSASRSSLDLHVIFITAALLFLLLTILALHFAIRCCLRRCFPAHSSSSGGGTQQPPPALPIASSRPATLKKKQLDSLPIITFHVIRPHNDGEVHMPPRHHHDNQNCSDNGNGGNANADADATEGRGSCRPTEAYEHMSGGDAAVCAICLAEFTAGERLRRLPACGHVFHATCVGTWLASHSASCPICRASPLLDRPSSNYTSSSSSSPPLELRILITTPSNPKPLLNPN